MTPPAGASRVLIVDDEPANVRLLERILQKAGFGDVVGTTDPSRVMEIVLAHPPDLVLLDLRMPGLDGFELLRLLQAATGDDDFLPVIVLTAEDSEEVKERALSAGATDFLTKPFRPFEILLRIRNLLRARRLHVELQRRNRDLEERVVHRTAELARAQSEMLERLAQAVEARDGETGEHTRRVGENAALLARSLGIDEDRVQLIRRAAPLHDVGKIAIPDSILLKPGPLTPEEFEVVKAHTTGGARILGRGGSELMRAAERIALAHHERWDGSGYPDGLREEDIPIEARIVAAVDVFDALAHDRPYRRAWPAERVVEEIRRERGRHFDPAVADALVALAAVGLLMR